MRDENEEVIVYTLGLVYCGACTTMTDKDEIRRRVNQQCPTGIDSDWDFSPEEEFATGQPNPCPCEKDPTRTHYLMVLLMPSLELEDRELHDSRAEAFVSALIYLLEHHRVLTTEAKQDDSTVMLELWDRDGHCVHRTWYKKEDS